MTDQSLHARKSKGKKDDERWHKAHRFDALPFVCVAVPGQGRNFWAPHPTGDYGFDCSLGVVYATAVLPMLREPRGRDLFRLIMFGILEHGDKERDAGVLVGFLAEIGAAIEAQAGRPVLAYQRPPTVGEAGA